MDMSRRAFLRTASLAVAGTATGAVAATITTPASAATRVSGGSFKGLSRHITTGNVELVRDGNTIRVILQDDFSFDGAPDPKVGFGHNGFSRGTLIGKLKSNNGRQSYTVPARLNVADYNEVYIWCERFNVPLGVAKLRG
ncbi:MAG: DM13 domain-containing protein [Pseudomonadota bacterium]